MKKIACNFFNEGESLFFNIARLTQLEQATGKTIQELMNLNLSLFDVVNAYAIGLGQYRNINKKRSSVNWYMEEIQRLIDEGVEFQELLLPIIEAIVASGIMGKAAYYAVFPEEMPDDYVEVDDTEKN